MTPKPARTARTAAVYALIVACRAVMIALAVCLPARAAEVALYQVTVPLKGNTEGDRNIAFAEALRSVVVRASGERAAGADPAVSAAADGANRLVQRYTATSDRQLKVGFDAAAIDKLLQQAGLPAWPSERPATLVLMAAPGVAGGARAIRAGERPAERTELEQAAQARGVPLVWPVAEIGIDAARAQSAGPGLDDLVTAAGTPADAVLFGSGAGGRTDWTLVHAGQSAQRRGTIADGAHLAADSFADRYAPASTRGESIATVRVDGVDGLQAYAGLMQELESLSMVRKVAVSEVDRATVRLQLTLRGDLELLRRIAALTPSLRPTGGSDPGAPDFVYEP
jgi:hypothetical protein